MKRASWNHCRRGSHQVTTSHTRTRLTQPRLQDRSLQFSGSVPRARSCVRARGRPSPCGSCSAGRQSATAMPGQELTAAGTTSEFRTSWTTQFRWSERRATRTRQPHANATRHVSESERVDSSARHDWPCKWGVSVATQMKLIPASRGIAGGPPAGVSQSIQADLLLSANVRLRSGNAAAIICVPPDVASVPHPSIAVDLRPFQSTLRTTASPHPMGWFFADACWLGEPISTGRH